MKAIVKCPFCGNTKEVKIHEIFIGQLLKIQCDNYKKAFGVILERQSEEYKKADAEINAQIEKIQAFREQHNIVGL